MRNLVRLCLIGAATSLVACSHARFQPGEALAKIEHCVTGRGFAAEDVTRRYKTEPAFKVALDECAEEADSSPKLVFKVMGQVDELDRAENARVAACMAEKGTPVKVYEFENTTNLGDLDENYDASTKEQFFKNFEVCNEPPKASNSVP